MCELLELCVPLCVCVLRTFQFGLLGIGCIFHAIDECCIKPCCPNCCREKKKAISQEDVRDDMVDAAWGESKPEDKKQSKPTVTQPYSVQEIPEYKPKKPNMDQGWNDSPALQEQLQIDSGWDNTPLNLEQPCSDERISSSNSQVPDRTVPNAPSISENTNILPETSTNTSTVSTTILPNPESSVLYKQDSFRPSTPPPSYEASQRQDMDA